MKKDIKFRELNILNVTLLFVKSVLLGKAKRIFIYLIRVIFATFITGDIKMELTVKPDNVFICRGISCYYM